MAIQQPGQFRQRDVYGDTAAKVLSFVHWRGNGDHHPLAGFILIGRRPEHRALGIVLRLCHTEHVIGERFVAEEILPVIHTRKDTAEAALRRVVNLVSRHA